MMAVPSRSTSAAARSTIATAEPPVPVSAAADAGLIDTDAAQAAVETRVAAMAARAPSPDDEALEEQREAFDSIVRVQAETDREINALRDMAMEQMKQDDELLKKWIELI